MSVIHLSITSKNSPFPYETRYSPQITLGELKSKLELVVGISAQDMKLELNTDDGRFVCELTDDAKTLESLGVWDRAMLTVIDTTGCSQSFDNSSDTSSRYMIDDEKYENRKDTVRKWMKELGADKADAPLPDFIQVGKRCVVEVQKQAPKTGVIAYAGKTHFKPGNWVGVIYDKAVGKNDGSLDGKRYFTCEPNHGGFVLPKSVFPLEDDAQNATEQIEEL